jgi:hypothetical protein
MHQKLKYKIETESNQQINFMDLNICRGANEFTLGIYRKPTYTDTVAFIVNNTIKISCKSSGQYDKYKNSGRI